MNRYQNFDKNAEVNFLLNKQTNGVLFVGDENNLIQYLNKCIIYYTNQPTIKSKEDVEIFLNRVDCNIYIQRELNIAV